MTALTVGLLLWAAYRVGYLRGVHAGADKFRQEEAERIINGGAT